MCRLGHLFHCSTANSSGLIFGGQHSPLVCNSVDVVNIFIQSKSFAKGGLSSLQNKRIYGYSQHEIPNIPIFPNRDQTSGDWSALKTTLSLLSGKENIANFFGYFCPVKHCFWEKNWAPKGIGDAQLFNTKISKHSNRIPKLSQKMDIQNPAYFSKTPLAIWIL